MEEVPAVPDDVVDVGCGVILAGCGQVIVPALVHVRGRRYSDQRRRQSMLSGVGSRHGLMEWRGFSRAFFYPARCKDRLGRRLALRSDPWHLQEREVSLRHGHVTPGKAGSFCHLELDIHAGNLIVARELETLMIRVLVTTSPRARIEAETLRPMLPQAARRPLFDKDLIAGRDIEELKTELERVYLTELFRRTRGDVKEMMGSLGVKRASLYRRLQRAGIDLEILRQEL